MKPKLAVSLCDLGLTSISDETPAENRFDKWTRRPQSAYSGKDKANGISATEGKGDRASAFVDGTPLEPRMSIE